MTLCSTVMSSNVARHLEGAADAGAGMRFRRGAGHVLAGEDDAAGGRQCLAGEAVEEGRFAGAVRADQADDLALVHGEIGARRPRGSCRTPWTTFLASSSMGAPPALRHDAVPQLEQAARFEARDQHDDAAVEDVGQSGAAAAEQVLVAVCSGIRISAPTSGPNSVPAPPSAATITICTETRMPKPLSGSMKPVLTA